MKAQLQISAKNLGALALPTFCPRCFWLRMICGDKLPYQIFPGIFASIDSYSKRVTMKHYQQRGCIPNWFSGFGDLGMPIPVPGWSRFQILDSATNILLTGVPDELLRHPKHGLWIGDYKTARFTDAQDALAPMYQVQLNCYAVIAAGIGLGPIYGLGLLYYEPVTDITNSDRQFLIQKDRFFLEFSPKLKPVKPQPNLIPPLLRRVRAICDSPASPTARPGCRDCCTLERLIRATIPASSSFKDDLIKSLDIQRSTPICGFVDAST